MTEQTPAGFDMLPSPYFFVPVDEKVWIPSDPIPSHDRPVKEGLSGHLRITLTAKTPIFIRAAGEHPKEPAQKKASAAYQSFYTLPNGTPAIPATSFNGMLRNVFEIITFSKLQPLPDEPMSISAGRQGRMNLGPMRSGLSKAHLQTGPSWLDAAERLFGTVHDQFGLRKRVTAQPLPCSTKPRPITDRSGNGLRTVVGSPRATYFPHYVQQAKASPARIKGRTYTTSNTQDFRIAGWKRYAVSHVLDDRIPLIVPPINKKTGSVNEQTCTWFRPLPTGTAFTGDVHFHNLRPWEFGALLWALTFGGRENLCHSVGFGKPLGLGAVQLHIDWGQSSILNACSKPVPTTDVTWQKAQRDSFEDALCNSREGILSQGTPLAQHPSIRELLLLADLQRGDDASNVLHYPRDVKHFAEAKKQGFCLPLYHELFPDQAAGSSARPSAARPAQARQNTTHQGYTQIIAPKPAAPPLPPATVSPKPAVPVKARVLKQTNSGLWRVQEEPGTPLQCGLVEDSAHSHLQVGDLLDLLRIKDNAPRDYRYRLIEQPQV